MADWTDGAQYAPLERPAAFAMPSTEPLEATPAPANPAAGQPDVAPRGWGEPSEARPLRELVPAVGPTRDPQEPFPAEQVANGPWAAAHTHWEPTMPLGEGIEDRGVVTTLDPGAFPPPTGAPLPAPVGAPVTTPLPAGAFPPPESPQPSTTTAPAGAPGTLPAPTGRPVGFPPPGQPGMPGLAVTPDPYAALPGVAGDPYAQAAPPGPNPQAAQPNPYTTVPNAAVPQALPQQAPGNGLPSPMTPAAPPQRPKGTLGQLVSGLGPVMLGSLALGVFLNFFAVICYFVASILARRATIGQRVLQPALQVAGVVFLVDLVASYTIDWAPSVNTTTQVICGALFLAAVIGGLLDLRQRR